MSQERIQTPSVTGMGPGAPKDRGGDPDMRPCIIRKNTYSPPQRRTGRRAGPFCARGIFLTDALPLRSGPFHAEQLTATAAVVSSSSQERGISRCDCNFISRLVRTGAPWEFTYGRKRSGKS